MFGWVSQRVNIMKSGVVFGAAMVLFGCGSDGGAAHTPTPGNPEPEASVPEDPSAPAKTPEEIAADCAVLEGELLREAGAGEDRAVQLLGKGLSSTTGELSETCVTGAEPELSTETAALVTAGPSSINEIRLDLGLMAPLPVLQTVDLNRSAEEQFLASIDVPPNAAIGALISAYERGFVHRESALPRLADTVSSLTSDPSAFGVRCGDRYIRQVKVGGLLVIVHVVDLTGFPDADRADLTYGASTVFFKGKVDQVHPHERYVFALGSDRWNVAPSTLDDDHVARLFTCYGGLADKSPSPLFGAVDDYDFFFIK